ncbi:tetratricopeptide repeat protein [Thalassotalea sp. PLHSN55]|uniref:tetratricopeptide repeat protein n=1 Tax=Thalassotalea sp. PLHSN55 TaxID=3435888 RepID=UPI003F836647
MSELQSDKKDCLSMFSLLEEFIFSTSPENEDAINTIISQCQMAIEPIEHALERAEVLINALFIDHIFIENDSDFWPSAAFKTESAIANRFIEPSLKAAILCHIIRACGFDSDIVFVPEKLMVRIICDDIYAIIFDPVNGESLNGYELDLKLEEVNADPHLQTLNAISQQELMIRFLTALKSTLIRETAFDQALKCVDIILAMRPDDPIERRDRGFLLHQLDCFKVAYDDYRYFVEQCPKDPAAQLLKLQLENISVVESVLH